MFKNEELFDLVIQLNLIGFKGFQFIGDIYKQF